MCFGDAIIVARVVSNCNAVRGGTPGKVVTCCSANALRFEAILISDFVWNIGTQE